jgi:hypothetical protein
MIALPPSLTEWVMVYTQVLKNAKGRYTGPPGPRHFPQVGEPAHGNGFPILGGNDPRFCISPPSIGGLGGLMQSVHKKSYLCVHGSQFWGKKYHD